MRYLQKSLATIALGAALSTGCGEDAELSFIDCLVDKGVHGYSGWWCDPCKVQEERLRKELDEDWPYFKEQVMVECYEPGKYFETQVCEDKGIAALPAWEFSNDQETEWEYAILPVNKIAEYSGCEY